MKTEGGGIQAQGFGQAGNARMVQTLGIAQQRILGDVDPEAVESAVVMPADAASGATQADAQAIG